MQFTISQPARLGAISLAVLAVTLSAPALSASACKGLEQAACETTDGCRWQAGYTRKDGIEVTSHCRTGKKKEVSESAPAAAPASAPEPTPPATPATPAQSTEQSAETAS